MTNVTPDERYWLEDRWRETAEALFRAMRPHLEDPVQGLLTDGEIPDAVWRTVLKRTAEALAKAQDGCPPHRAEMYSVAIALLQDGAPVRRRLEHAARTDALAHDEGGVPVTALRQGLPELKFAMTSESPAKARRWSKLDAISRALHKARAAAGLERYEDGRCHDDHFEALEAHIRQNKIGRVPTTKATIADYFKDFCADCHDLVEGGPDFDWRKLGARDLLTFPDLGENADHLQDCLKALPKSLRAAVQAFWHVNEPRDMAQYCAEERTNRFRVRRLAYKALPELAECITDKIERALA